MKMINKHKLMGMALGFASLFSATGSSIAQTSPTYIASEIPMSEDTGRPFFADMDGDGALDVLVGHWSALEGRELYIYLQQSDGHFPGEPSRRVEIKAEIIAVATADLGNHPGDELIFVASDAVYSFSSTIQSYSGNIQKLFDWPLIASTPHRKSLIQLGELPDINGDGIADIALPYAEGVGVFLGNEDYQFELSNKIKTIEEDFTALSRSGFSVAVETPRLFDDEGNIVVGISTETSSEFGGFLREWQPKDADRLSGSLLSKSDFIPGVTFASISDELISDILFLNAEDDQPDQISLITQHDDGTFSADVEWRKAVNEKGDLRLVDFTGDGLDDIIRIYSRTNDDWDLFFYQNTEGEFSFDNPDQIMKFSGYDLNLNLIDLNNDNKPELNISFFTIPKLDVIRDIKVQRTRLVYKNNGVASDEQQTFDRRPTYKLEEKFSADNILALTSTMNLSNDINNDQQHDYIFIASDGTLQAKTVHSETLQFGNNNFWQYVPDHTILNLSVKELNADTTPDMILYHSLYFTLLISTQ